MTLPSIAIIGRPNVGKSTLVNRLCQSNYAIVFDKPGVTRDRTYQKASWGGKEFQIVDKELILPHPRFMNRNFVITPLSEILNRSQKIKRFEDPRWSIT